MGAGPTADGSPVPHPTHPAPYAALLVAVAGLLSVIMAGTGGTAAGTPSEGQDGSAPCPTPSPWYSNSPLYPQICGEPAFQAVLEQVGISNFTWDLASGPAWVVVYPTFNWVGSCGNSTWASYEPQCEDQEYWAANITAGTISGPTVWEGPLTCACGEESASQANPWPFVILLWGSTVAVAAVVVSAVVWWRRQRPPPPDESSALGYAPTASGRDNSPPRRAGSYP
jgi:hypothetical protein